MMLNWFRKKNKEIEKADENNSEVAGYIYLEYETTGDFSVSTNILDISEESQVALTRLLVGLHNGQMTPYIYQSFKLWASESVGDAYSDSMKKVFYTSVLQLMMEAFKNLETDADPAIKASEVFGGDNKK